ncbi:MAG: type IA DNA topoisomerase [Thermoproteales archaeon]|nr:type IA DNA topoisomerase [Thermoproteales archaeon]
MDPFYDTIIIAEKPGVAKAFAYSLSNPGRPKIISINRITLYSFKYKNKKILSFGVSGHILNFDFQKKYNNWKNTDPRTLFFIDPIQIVRKGSWKYYDTLRKLSQKTNHVILALDADVEGESIAFEVMNIMKKYNPNIKFDRAWFSAITKEDILNAVDNLTKPNPNLANKAFARMIVDLTIGAAFTRILTLMIEKRSNVLPRGKFISYGPCQTPVLYLVVKRALEREKFKKKKYYSLNAKLTNGIKIFNAVYYKEKIESFEEANSILNRIKNTSKATVIKADYTTRNILPPEPLNTIELERRCSRFLNIRPQETLNIAENLYQDGLISYPRTETTKYPKTINLIKIAKKFIDYQDIGPFVRKIISTKISPRQGSEDDKAHPPIYPLKNLPKDKIIQKYGRKGWNIYNLVVRHFIATLSKPAVIEKQKIIAKIKNEKFIIEGLKIIEEGFYTVYPYDKPSENILPYLLPNDTLEVIEIKIIEKETKPPPYLSESQLLKLMKKYGIGTDATMQDHIQTNIKRKYFVVDKKRCIPTPLGKILTTSLYETVPEIVEPEVRGKMERKLQKIAEGIVEPNEVIQEIKREFLEYYDRLRENEEELSKKLIKALITVYSNEYEKRVSRRYQNYKDKQRKRR